MCINNLPYLIKKHGDTEKVEFSYIEIASYFTKIRFSS